MYVIHNGNIIMEDSILTGHAVLIEGDRIKDVVTEKEAMQISNVECINANGGFISPGFIDIHSDYIESIVSPRPTSMMDMDISLREAEKILISHGITTIFHSLSFYKKDLFTHKPIRNPETVQRLVEAIHETHDRPHLIRHRLHARFELDNIEQIEQLVENIENDKVHLLSFMDHTPGQGQYRDLEVFSKTLKGYRNLSDEEVNVIILERKSREQMTLEKIAEVAKIADDKGIAVASHDDDNEEKLKLVQSFGTTISEFPITLNVAKEAKNLGLQTIVGAPNVLLGGSHSGNLSAIEAIHEDSADILCSDYFPAALLLAVFQLHEKHQKELHEMFKMVTLNPAKAVRMDDEIGSIKPGKKADILIINQMEDGYPMLTKTMVNGSLITTTNYRFN